MNTPSKIQIELLTLIAAKPYGYGLKIKQAAKFLHLKYDAARYQLKKFKETWPEKWAFIVELKKTKKDRAAFDRKMKRNLKKPYLVGTLDWGKIDTAEHSYPNEGNADLFFDDSDLGATDIHKTSKIVYLKIKERF